MATKKIKQIILKVISTQVFKEISILFSIFAVSMLIRWLGLRHGFPLLTQPDEDWIMNPLISMTRNSTLYPGNLNRPNQILYKTLFFYLNALSYLRFGENLADASPRYYLNFHLYARFLISVMGSMIPVMAYKIGKEFKPNFSLPAALVFTFFPSYVLHALFITTDVPITLFTLVVIYFTARYLNRDDDKAIYFAAMFAAINTAEKYPGLISLAIVFVGIFLKHIGTPTQSLKIKWRSFALNFLKLTLVFIAALFVVAPRLFLQFPQVIETLKFEARSTHLGADNLGWAGNLLFYLQAFASWTNILSVLWIGAGIVALIEWRNKYTLILLYGALHWVIISNLGLHWERWALPMYITPLFLVSIGIAYAWEKTKTIPITKYLSLAIISVFLFQQMIAAVHTSVKISFTDTRVAALNYCEENGITPDNSIYEGYSPFLPQNPTGIFDQDFTKDDDRKYILLSAKMYDRFYDEPVRYKEQIQFYENLRSSHHLLAEFSPEPPPGSLLDRINDIHFYIMDRLNLTTKERFRGPTIEIYQIVH